MRTNGISELSDISCAILETNGQVSFIPKKMKAPPSSEDMKLNIKEEPLSFPVVTKGSVNREYLKIINREENWLYSQVKKHNLDIDKILIMTANHQGIKFIQLEGGESN